MRVLLTGSGGVVGNEVAALLDRAADVTRVTRTPRRPGDVRWLLGTEPTPDELRGSWDVIVHAAASTRWTMTEAEAVKANVGPTRAALGLADERTHFVHVSTAYVEGTDDVPDDSEFGRYRNGYEWSKAQCEELVRGTHTGPLTVVRPPLILGSSADGAISRYSGPYTLLQTLVSGLAAAVVGDPEGFAEIAPVDQVAHTIAAATLAAPPDVPRTEVIAGGQRCLRLGTLIDVTCRTLNELRASKGIDPITAPPFISARRWHRFFLPMAREHLSPVQLQAVQLLGMFESYTSMSEPFTPTVQVEDPVDVLVRSIHWWARAKPRLALRTPEPWGLITTTAK